MKNDIFVRPLNVGLWDDYPKQPTLKGNSTLKNIWPKNSKMNILCGINCCIGHITDDASQWKKIFDDKKSLNFALLLSNFITCLVVLNWQVLYVESAIWYSQSSEADSVVCHILWLWFRTTLDRCSSSDAKSLKEIRLFFCICIMAVMYESVRMSSFNFEK